MYRHKLYLFIWPRSQVIPRGLCCITVFISLEKDYSTWAYTSIGRKRSIFLSEVTQLPRMVSGVLGVLSLPSRRELVLLLMHSGPLSHACFQLRKSPAPSSWSSKAQTFGRPPLSHASHFFPPTAGKLLWPHFMGCISYSVSDSAPTERPLWEVFGGVFSVYSCILMAWHHTWNTV